MRHPILVALLTAGCAPETQDAWLATRQAPPPVSLSLTGACPGPVEVAIDGATPNGTVTLLRSTGVGATTLASGPCAGLVTGLDPRPTELGPLTADATGSVLSPLTVPQAGCTQLYRALDLATCALSPLATPTSSPADAPSAVIVPSPASPCDPLQCVLDEPMRERGGGPITYSVSWTRNGMPYTGGTTQTTLPGDTVPAAATAQGETWACVIAGTDTFGALPSDPALSSVTSVPQTESVTIVQDPTSLVDILFVMDDSGSMFVVQDNFAQRAPAFIDGLRALGVDAHVGVVTTDMSSLSRRGRLVEANGFRFVSTANPAASTLLTQMLTPGTSGSATEQGLDAAFSALSPPLISSYNAGFRRPAADLALVFISDEPDQSVLVTPQQLITAGRNLEQRAGISLSAWTVVGAPPDGCDTPFLTTFGAGDGYLDLVDGLGGFQQSICEPDLAGWVEVFTHAVAGKPRHVALPGGADPAWVTVSAALPGRPLTTLPTNFWRYDPPSRAVLLALSPPTGTQVEVTYDPLCP